MNTCHLVPKTFASTIRMWLAEDVSGFDYTAATVSRGVEKATILAKQDTVLCGRPFVDMVMKEAGCEVEWLCNEGSEIIASSANRVPVAIVTGEAGDIMLGERLALNILQQASGIARHCSRFASLAKAHPTFRGVIAATRKVTPGFRLIQKYAVVVGGCDTHRMDLSSMVMLKDNAIEACGGDIARAVARAKAMSGFALKIEVECRNEREAMAAIATPADILMLDNFQPSEVHRVAKILKQLRPSVLIEVSGGITIDSVANFMGPHVDVISSSTLILGVPPSDFSMKILH